MVPKGGFCKLGIIQCRLVLNLHDMVDLEGHPKVGASWVGFAVDAVIRQLEAPAEDCYFWGTHSGAELDLLVVRGRHRLGFEFKRTVAPKVTRSMREAIKDLNLERLDVIHAGESTFPLANKIRAVAITQLTRELKSKKRAASRRRR